MKYVYIGKFEGTHGLKGEIKLKTDFKYIDRVLSKSFSFFIGDSKEKLNLNTYRNFKGGYLVSFSNLENIDLIKKYVNKKVYVLRDDLNLENNQYVFEDFIDCECFFDKKSLGKVVDIIDAGASNYIFYIQGEKEVLIPLNEHFIDRIEPGKIYFKNVEGLIDAN